MPAGWKSTSLLKWIGAGAFHRTCFDIGLLTKHIVDRRWTHEGRLGAMIASYVWLRRCSASAKMVPVS